MSTALQIEKHFIDAGKTLVANIAGATIGPFDNTVLPRPRLAVDFFIDEQLPTRDLARSGANAAVYYRSDYAGTWEFTVVHPHTETANHCNAVGQVRAIFAGESAGVASSVNTYYEVKDLAEAAQERVRDAEENEIRTTLRFGVQFSVKPW